MTSQIYSVVRGFTKTEDEKPEEKFLELADQLENGEIEGIELNKEDMILVTAILRGEDLPNLE